MCQWVMVYGSFLILNYVKFPKQWTNGNLVYTVFLADFITLSNFDVYGSILIFISAQNFERHKVYEAWEKLDC